MKKTKPAILRGKALYVATLAEKLFMHPESVTEFVEKNDIDALKLLTDVGSKRINSMDVMCAMIGEPGNPFFATLVQEYRLTA